MSLSQAKSGMIEPPDHGDCYGCPKKCCGYCTSDERECPTCLEVTMERKWQRIIEEHYDFCPMAIAAKENRISTLCMCKEIDAANEDAKKESNEFGE